MAYSKSQKEDFAHFWVVMIICSMCVTLVLYSVNNTESEEKKNTVESNWVIFEDSDSTELID
ncbi:MAG: hypothetical protein ACJASM_003064 [Salibacteraceae bacterium]|jgi:hypothetical protein